MAGNEASTPIYHSSRPLEDRLSDLELAVFGNPRQQMPGLIASVRAVGNEVTEIKDMVVKLRDNRLVWVQLIAQAATLVAALAALLGVLKP